MSSKYSDDISDTYLGPTEYSERLNCIHEMMPYDHFSRDPWEKLSDLRAYLDSLPDTVSTWMYREVDSIQMRGMFGRRMHLMAHLVGGWTINKKNEKHYRYVNPEYPQLDAIELEPGDDRYEHALRMAHLGVVSIEDVATRYNVNRKKIQRDFKAHGRTWSTERSYGRQRLANTLKLTLAWTEWTQYEVANLLRMDQSTVSKFIDRESTVDVPIRPCKTRRGREWSKPE